MLMVPDGWVDVPLGRLEQYQRHIDPVPVPGGAGTGSQAFPRKRRPLLRVPGLELDARAHDEGLLTGELENLGGVGGDL